MNEEEINYYEEEFLMRNEELLDENNLDIDEPISEMDLNNDMTFKEINQNVKILKEVKKHGMSVGITFDKKEQEKFKIKYGDIIDLSDAKIIINK